MNIEEVYLRVQETSEPDLQRAVIEEYLQSCVEDLENNPEARQAIAKNIARLLSTNYAYTLEEDDPLDATLHFAEELELVDEDDEDWDLLIEIIKSLE